jgi:tetratricopeptide (TPR) repeat protein
MRKARIGQRVFERRKHHFKKSSTGGLVLAGLTIGTLVLATGSMGQGRNQGGSKSERFDLSVREDFFSGFAGDMKALARGMKKCEQALAKDPKNAEALVWHGSGLSYDAKRAFMAGDVEKGRQIQAQAVKEMNDAVTMRPDDVSVLIPRGSIFLSAALHVPSPEVAKKDFQIAADDYEKVLRLQTPVFSKLPVHSRGELLGGLAEAWNGLGDTEKSRGYLQRMMEEFPDTSYSRRAREVLSTVPKPGALGTTCLGCHVGAAP